MYVYRGLYEQWVVSWTNQKEFITEETVFNQKRIKQSPLVDSDSFLCLFHTMEYISFSTFLSSKGVYAQILSERATFLSAESNNPLYENEQNERNIPMKTTNTAKNMDIHYIHRNLVTFHFETKLLPIKLIWRFLF